MRKASKFAVLIIIISANMLMSTSCWNYKELDKYSILSGIAIDKNPNNNNYIFTVEFVDFRSQGKQTIIHPTFVDTEGETLFDAGRNMLLLVNRKIYYPHAKTIIVSQDIAKEGLSKVLDLFYRDAEMRMNMYIVISKEKTAKEVLCKADKSQDLQGFKIARMLENQVSLGKVAPVQVYKYLNYISSKMESGIVPAIGVTETSGIITQKLQGTAVFKNDKLIGFLDTDQSKYLNLIIQKFKRGLLIERKNSNDDDRITIEVFGVKTKIKPKLENKELKMEINMELEVAIGELETTTDYIQNKDNLEKDLEENLEKNIKKIIKKAQSDFDADIFGFEQHIKANKPSVWDSIKDNWDEVFKNIDVEVKTKINIRNSAKASKPIKVGE